MRLWTRGDFDGLTSAVFLTEAEKIEELKFAHPKDVQDGKHPMDNQDILVNLPYVKGCGLWFDHHFSEERKLPAIGEFPGRFEIAPSAARVVYNHYRKPEFERFRELLEATDRFDSAQLTAADIENPEGWMLLGHTLDPRAGLGPEFQKYFRWLVEYVKEAPIAKVLEQSEVRKRARRVREEAARLKEFLRAHSRREDNVIITDLRGQREMPAGNRFLIYTLYPEANAEVRLLDGKGGQNVVVAVGHSVLNRTCRVDVGSMLWVYGGGGHQGAGTCQLPREKAEAALRAIVDSLRRNQPAG